MDIVLNPNLDMTTQIGWVFVSNDQQKRKILCNFCVRQLYTPAGLKFFAPISLDLEDFEPPLVCDVCKSTLGEGPALGGDVPKHTHKEEGPAIVAYVHPGGKLGVHSKCLEEHPEIRPIAKGWEEIRASATVAPEIKSLECMVCTKELIS